MIVFWTHNDQRKSRFLREDVVACSRGFQVLRSDSFVYLHNHRRRTVVPAALFNDETTPWTHVGPMTQMHPFRWLAMKNERFPKTYIARNGDILTLDGTVIFQAPEATRYRNAP